MAWGASIYAERAGDTMRLEEAIARIEAAKAASISDRLPRLFESTDELDAFRARHARASVRERELADYQGDAWLGIDCGSTTTKLVLISQDKELLYTSPVFFLVAL